MCGLAGILDLRSDLSSAEALVGRMTDALVYRGQDDAGILVDHPLILGHRRLSIFDLSPRARQPFANRDGRRWVVYNGEVYNHFELADELRSHGHEFRTTCDTEVLLAAFDEWGIDALDRLNGDFAFAIWDRDRQELLCVRDRFGAKPFYYTVVGERFRFASEIKALLLDPEVPRVPNDRRVLEFLAYELIDHASETLFDGILQLPAGSYMTVTPQHGPGEPVVWYRPSAADLGERPPSDVLRERFTEAVRLRLRSDVPLGVALSGGLDSSSVMSLGSRLLAEEDAPPPICFTARCNDPRIDEGEWAQYVIQATGARNIEVTPNDRELLPELDTLLWHMDEPFHSPTVYGHWKVLELAQRSDVVVVLEGQAGDEIFCGYVHTYPSTFYSFLRMGHFRRFAAELRWRQRRNRVSVGRSLRELAKLLVPNHFRRRKLPRWLAPDISIPRPPFPRRLLRGRQMYLLGVAPLPAFLHHDDRNSMSLGLESRSPFLDHNVVELGLALEAGDLVNTGLTKWALREAMRDVVSFEILERPAKQGFSVDQSDWFARGDLGDVVEETFRSERMASRSYFNREGLLADLEAHRAGERDAAGELWRAFIVERWLRLFIDPAVLNPPTPHANTPISSVAARDNTVRLGAADTVAA